jgi:hypothetical protein
MQADDYQRFGDRLQAGLALDNRVLGLVALGSMSGEPPLADNFSDHDFFVLSVPGAQEEMRTNLSWLPEAGQIALSYRETAHGVKAIYRSGHLIEFAIFDLQELELARVNRYRVLIDGSGHDVRGHVEERMRALRERTARENESRLPGLQWLAGQFITELLIGASRFLRGEKLAGRARVQEAVRDLLQLIARTVPAANEGALDSLDPLRRFEQVHPGLAAQIDLALAQPPPAAALLLLSLARRELGPRMTDFPETGARTVEEYLSGLLTR